MKKLLTTGALLLSCASAHTSPMSWGFSYSGFFDQEANQFLTDETIHGAFTGDDLNSNGLLEMHELQSLVIGELDYIACAASSNAYYQCGATAFSFSSNAGLNFAVGSYGNDREGWVGGGRLITTGDQHYDYDYNPNTMRERHLMWTTDTQLTMMSTSMATISAVPEPATLLLFASGLAAIGWGARRRTKGV